MAGKHLAKNFIYILRFMLYDSLPIEFLILLNIDALFPLATGQIDYCTKMDIFDHGRGVVSTIHQL